MGPWTGRDADCNFLKTTGLRERWATVKELERRPHAGRRQGCRTGRGVAPGSARVIYGKTQPQDLSVAEPNRNCAAHLAGRFLNTILRHRISRAGSTA